MSDRKIAEMTVEEIMTDLRYCHRIDAICTLLRIGQDLCAEVERLRGYEEDHRRVLAEECGTDEKHCTCVPALRREVERLRAELLESNRLRDDALHNAWELGEELDNLHGEGREGE